MQTLLLRFAVTLKDSDPRAPDSPNGPLFHRWIPDGEKDSITLEMPDQKAVLKLWFERRGHEEKGVIVFDDQRHEVKEEVMTKQAILDAGPLRGQLELRDLSAEDLKPIQGADVNDERYVALGKTVVTKLIYPSVSRLINILRTNYGQYWIAELERWDSRKWTLNRYCRLLDLECSLDSGSTWTDFLPQKQRTMKVTVKVRVLGQYRDYLTKEVWPEISDAVAMGYEPSPAAFVLLQSHRLLRQGNLKYAIIEAVTALELAIHEFIRRRLGGRVEPASAFLGLKSESAQVAVIAATLGIATDLDLALKCIATRHKIVHEGFTPSGEATGELVALLEIVSAMLEGPPFRFPTADPANEIRTPAEWESQYETEDRVW
jgi:hypothetical protein